MGQQLKIGVIGDYDFTHNAHHATNLALDHAASFLEIELSYYWIRLHEAIKFRPQQFFQYDGFLIAPGTVSNDFFLNSLLRTLLRINIPVLVTGEGFKNVIETLASIHQLTGSGEKLISDNIVKGNQFERVEIRPHSPAFIELYKYRSTIELTSCRYGLYPQLVKTLEEIAVDVDGYNEFDEPEIISLKSHPFFVAASFSPQISSTRELAHPIIYTFVKVCTPDFKQKAN